MDDTRIRTMLTEFLGSSVPDYIVEASRELLGENSMQKLKLKKGEAFWEAEGSIQGDDLQVYSPKLTLSVREQTTNYECNCQDSFSGVCRHVAAAALELLAELETHADSSLDAMRPRVDWRQIFRSFFSAEPEPEAGRHYLILRFYPEPGRLQVAFFRGRQNKSGLSSVHTPVTLRQIMDNPEICDLSPDFPLVARLIAGHEEYSGHRVSIPDGLLSWFLWSVRNEYYLLWKDTDSPCRIERRNLHLKIRPNFSESEGLTLALLLHSENKPPLPIEGTETTFHGHTPMWVCRPNSFFPVYSTLESGLVQELTRAPLAVPREDISEFLDRVWSRLPTSALYEQEDFLQLMEPFFVPAKYNPKLFLDEEGSLLTLQIQNIYETIHGEFAMPGPNPDFQTGSYAYEGKTYLVRRRQEEEAALTNMLTEIQFQPRNARIWFLEPEEAVTFLLDVYPRLVKTYRIYGEAALTRYKVHLCQPVISAEVKSNEEEKLLNLDITVQYDGQSVSLEKIWKAWTQGKRYVQLRDGSYSSLPEVWLERIAGKLQALGLDPSKPPKGQFAQFGAPVLDSLLEELPGAATDPFWDTLRNKINSFREITPVSPPAGLNATLRGYQKQGLAYLNFLREYNFGGILADEMGLGKTVQTLSFIQHIYERGARKPNLIVVPTSVLPNWEKEAEKFVPGLSLLTIYGAKREGMFQRIRQADLVLTTYALLRRDLEELEKYEFGAIILDEAQNIKNPNTITARSVRHIRADMRLCLSGTPIENNLFELWSLFEFLMPGFLGAQHYFRRNVVRPIKEGDDAVLSGLRLRVRPFILRRTKAEVAKDLPPKIENTYFCGLAEDQAELYAMLARKLREQVLNTVDANGMAKSQMSILDALLKLRQICCHPRLLRLDLPDVSISSLGSGKFDVFKDMVTDIMEEGHRVLVFSQFVQMLHIIRSWLQLIGTPFCYLDGASKDRFEQVERFNNEAEIPIFLISLKAGGTGLNLTGADYVIHYDPWWNPAVENQATDRTHRIGQTRQVFSYKLICRNTVEEKILKLQESKKNVAASVIPGAEAWKSLSREDLEMLFEV
ncbi:MAG: DEAD/DEAH box helicase [Desulfovibrio sp.]|jgi:non-specific serine/threonine protein kinase|nr:DEAD/DEAH box helicase [Desulfovibrio sp.]